MTLHNCPIRSDSSPSSSRLSRTLTDGGPGCNDGRPGCEMAAGSACAPEAAALPPSSPGLPWPLSSAGRGSAAFCVIMGTINVRLCVSCRICCRADSSRSGIAGQTARFLAHDDQHFACATATCTNDTHQCRDSPMSVFKDRKGRGGAGNHQK